MLGLRRDSTPKIPTLLLGTGSSRHGVSPRRVPVGSRWAKKTDTPKVHRAVLMRYFSVKSNPNLRKRSGTKSLTFCLLYFWCISFFGQREGG
jgi:hypothetical protein